MTPERQPLISAGDVVRAVAIALVACLLALAAAGVLGALAVYLGE
jgi:hypothetical protein